MKTFRNFVSAFVELRNVGDSVVTARVATSLRLNLVDSSFVGDQLLQQLLPEWVSLHRLYDGTYVLVSGTSDSCITNMCVKAFDRDLDAFSAQIELEDSNLHDVTFSFRQSDFGRRDYIVGDTRYIRIVGTVSVQVESDEESEE